MYTLFRPAIVTICLLHLLSASGLSQDAQSPVYSESQTLSPSQAQNWTPTYYGGDGTGEYRFSVAYHTNWDTLPWTPPSPGTYIFRVQKLGDSDYWEAMSEDYTLAVAKLAQPPVFSQSLTLTPSQAKNWVPLYQGGTGTAIYRFSVAGHTNWDTQPWTPPGTGSYTFRVQRLEDADYLEAMSEDYTLNVVQLLQPPVYSNNAIISMGQDWTPDFHGGAGSGLYRFSVAYQTNWDTAGWTPPAPGIYTFRVQKVADSDYSEAMSDDYTLNVIGTTVNVSTIEAGLTQQTNLPIVGDVAFINSQAIRDLNSSAVKHSLVIFRPATASETSDLPGADAAWNEDGWGFPPTWAATWQQYGFNPDYGKRPEFSQTFSAENITSNINNFKFVLDAPGTWKFKSVIKDSSDNILFESEVTTINVDPINLNTSVTAQTYPVQSPSKRLVGAFYNAGYEHRGCPDGNWSHMWRPSPYPNDPRINPYWDVYWGAHQAYAIVPDSDRGSRLTHDITSIDFARRAAIRMMDVGIDFLIIDDTNSSLQDPVSTDPIISTSENLKLGLLQAAAETKTTPIQIAFMLSVAKGAAWESYNNESAIEQFDAGITKFNTKLSYIYNHFNSDNGFHWGDSNKPLLVLYIGSPGGTVGEIDQGTQMLKPEYLDRMQVTLENGMNFPDGSTSRKMTDVFEVRYMCPGVRSYPVLQTNAVIDGTSQRLVGYGYWSHPHEATLSFDATGEPSVEMASAEPKDATPYVNVGSIDADRFSRGWGRNADGAGYLIEEPTKGISPENYGNVYMNSLEHAISLHPKILIAGWWVEFGSENDERNPDCSHTLIDNNKFGSYYGDLLKQYIRDYKKQ